MINKEYGSDFHICLESKWHTKEQSFFFENTSFFLSGRAALYSLLQHGIKKNNWETVYFPSFYCHEVVTYAQSLSIEIKTYPFNPFLDDSSAVINIKDDYNSVIIIVDYFGLNKTTFPSIKKAVKVEDLTHSLNQIKNSKADFIFGSLRKELPIPTGGFLASKKQYNLPKGKENTLGTTITVQKLTAMYLKKRYLNGDSLDKETFRELFITGEKKLQYNLKNAKLPKLSKALLKDLNITKILKTKKENIDTALKTLNIDRDYIFNSSNKLYGAGLVLKLNSTIVRDNLKMYLIKNNIFPAILWPNQNNNRDKEIEQKVLFLHLDYRYDNDDVKYITHIINLFFENEKF